MEKGTLGNSKKYTNGSIHENASGKFQILDRYLGENEKAWLKYQWLSGEKGGQIEENKEENINASLYKYRVSRGNAEPIKQNEDVVTLGQLFELVEDSRIELFNEMQNMQNKIDNQQKKIDDLIKLIDLLVQRNDLVTKLVDKL